MRFELSEDHEQFRRTVRDFAGKNTHANVGTVLAPPQEEEDSA